MNNSFVRFCKEKKVMLLIFFAGAIVISLLTYMEAQKSDMPFIKEEDQVIGIKGDYLDQGVTLKVQAAEQDITVDRTVTIRKQQENSGNAKETTGDPELELDTKITGMLRAMDTSGNKDIMLPRSIGDSAELSWQKQETKGAWVLPLFFPILIMIFLYRGQIDELDKKEKSEVRAVIQELPSFNNKLVLLMGSGLVYEESLRRVCTGRESSPLQRVLMNTLKEAESTNRNATKLLGEYAKRKKINELKRITTIIMDNQRKGTDLRSKLALEGELLWDKRKKQSEEDGRIAESKLTLPLGIMMVALLIVTAGPALLQM